ncbi:hypothetical protein [Streptomyces sp. NBC_01264]|uniref:hypothetical protein n=1 Tax=Streptomyces sp. NBC_01264 TaxID=2903804 RepID=UPI002254015A|nr:hypothetical protein [Streptomyces sp. NBC_01264]MCX4780745.1 hypothetical protein [Streptomyces sp. NBC_01264]
MITEPEFDGGSSGIPGPEGPREPLEPRADERSPWRPGRQPWRWALGGALTASLLWAGAWWAVAPQDGRPPLRYALPASLCDEAKLPTLSRLAEVSQWNPTPKLFEHPGVDQAYCQLGTSRDPSDGLRLTYQIQTSMSLHKRTDPAPEFGADPAPAGWTGLSRLAPHSVPGLGERALIWEMEYEQSWRLAVLDGGAVFTMDVTVWAFGSDAVDGEGNLIVDSGPPQDPPKADADAVQAAMIDDMNGLMKALRE